jgi:hypothetical protein
MLSQCRRGPVVEDAGISWSVKILFRVLGAE